jgi:hypothetical protein
MAMGDVRRFMRQHARELRFVLQSKEQPLRDVDVSARHRESIDLVRIDDAELPIQVRPARVARHGHPDAAHVRLKLLIRIRPARLLLKLRMTLAADLNLFLLADRAAGDEDDSKEAGA